MNLLNGTLSHGACGRLTERELVLLSYLVQRCGEVVPRHELTVAAFGYAPAARSRAVDKAMYSLRRKVERDPSQPEHLHTSVGVGYRFTGLGHDTCEPHHTVPALVGRHEELRDVGRRILERGVTTVWGPIGVGKTELVRVALASFLRDASDQAVAWCLVGDASNAATFVERVAAGVGQSVHALDSEQAGQGPRERMPQVVVLDGWTPCATTRRLVETWRRRSRSTTWVCTTTTLTGLRDERPLRLEPLEPEVAAKLFLRLVHERGYAVERSDALDELIDHLGGLPSALVAAASRIGALGVRDILERLRAGPGLLRDMHDKLIVAWSRLSGCERQVLEALAAADADLATLRHHTQLESSVLLEAVTRLVDSAWLQATHHHEHVRLGLLPPMRSFVVTAPGGHPLEVA